MLPACPLKKPETTYEQGNPHRNAPENRAMALSFTLHDLTERLYQLSLARQRLAIQAIIAEIQMQLAAYDQGGEL